MENIISIQNLSKRFKKDTVLKNINLDIKTGYIYGLIGRNGAGKTTLLKTIVGILKPTFGNISIQGSFDEKTLALSRNNIGYYIESGMFFQLDAFDNLCYRCKVLGIKDEKKEINRVLNLLKMNNIKKPFKTYSMGMKQRVEIAAALMGYPDIVILDEPLNGLDPEGIYELKGIIKDINEKYETTFIISSHILSELQNVADNFVFFDKGNLVKNIDKNQLEAECSEQLIIKTDNPKKAVFLIEENLKTNNFTVNNEQEIILHDLVDNPQIVADLMYDNGVHLLKLQPYSITLEEYFLKMLGDM